MIAEKIFCDGTVGVLWAAGEAWTSISQVRAGEEVGVDDGTKALFKTPFLDLREGCHAERRLSCGGAIL